MVRFVIGADVALRLARDGASIPADHALVAPTLLRSQVLSRLYGEVRSGALDRRTADAHLDYLRSLKIRLLGDRVLQRVAWNVAAELGWPDTFFAEYIAATQLQADAFATLDPDLARAARDLVQIATLDDLVGGNRPTA